MTEELNGDVDAQPEESVEENTPTDEEEGEESEESDAPTSIKEAKQVVKELKEENKKLVKNLERAEKMATTDILSGKSQAGTPKVEKEETPQEYAKRIMAGRL